MKTVFGIDVSKSTSNVAILVDSKAVKQFKIDNDLIGFGRLESDLNSFINPEVVFEATGIYSRRLAFYLQTHHFPYTQLNPLQASKEMDGLRKNKTDKNDALHLAETQFRLHRQKTLLQDPIYSELMDESRFYQEEISDFVQEKNRLHRILQITFPELTTLMSAPTGIVYWNIVKKFPIPSKVRKYGIDQLTQIIYDFSNHNISVGDAKKIALKLTDISKIAVSTVSPNSLTLQQVKHHADRLMNIDKMKKRIIRSMEKLAVKLPEYQSILSIPGFSTVTTVSLIAELGDIRRFSTTNQINAFVGIDLRHYESGNYTASDRISKRGNPYARKILYQAVIDMVSISRYQPTHINDFYQKKKQPSQHGTKKIAVASMSRLIRTIYHLVIKNETYDYKIASQAVL
ncbi:IS110 family transposase [Companilactobacillus mishanensis]|uniref:IS110 family transposase n=1 Tax=Companilactobacillus mishanensis TaxID=2486008 RepID=UPI0012949BE7|nr:IS110 family transposase [Companilactobacillus mishanensis]MQS90359.1 IS110 family transposase [Companilactobacillus mishanensis]